MGIFKFSDPPYGGSNEVFGKNQNFPLFLNIKLHLKMPVNFNFLNILSFLGGSVPPPTVNIVKIILATYLVLSAGLYYIY